MIKDILVHLDGTPDDETRIAYSYMLAKLFKAYITGLFLNTLPYTVAPVETGYGGAEFYAEIMKQARKEGDRLEHSLKVKLDKLEAPHEIRRFDVFADEIANVATVEARWADIAVLLRPFGPNGISRWPELMQGVLFGSGRSILLVPDMRPASDGFDRILVAWNSSREAAHAVDEAMPFLRKAREVALVTVSEEAPSDEERKPGADLTSHLDRHGVKVSLHNLRSNNSNVANAILNEAQSQEADLIVAGGYGHSRLREWALGGVTRELLHQSPFPLLMAH
ncbi:universal stress protein [Microvirga sp. 2TAF3]|uniref:universal stress protein n=1 Tax=Microvirga sp. 2TAF3 TaxID=3233014 RepID=UPI003F970A6D